MAMSTQIERPSDSWSLDGPGWLHEPPPRGNLKWSDVSEDPGYVDYAAVISASDLLDWHRRDRHFAFEGEASNSSER